MRKIHLYGRLKKVFPKPVELDVETAGEAVRALAMQSPKFLEVLKDGSYEVVRGNNRRTGLHLDLEDINTFRLGKADLHIVPVVAGAKNTSAGAIAKTVVGVALIGAAIYFSGGTLAAPLAGSGLLSGVTWGNIALFGAATALAGVSQMLAKPAKVSKDDDKKQSFSLSGPNQSFQQGGAVPLVYGEVITSPVVVSAGIDIERVTV